MDSSTIPICSICEKPLDNETSKSVNVREKGLNTLIMKSQEFGDDKWKLWTNVAVLVVHDSCRKRYSVASKRGTLEKVRRRNCSLPSTSNQNASSKRSLSAETELENDFNFSELCFICAKPWERRHMGSMIQRDYMKEVLLDAIEQRDDQMARDVMCRITDVVSLVDVGARYHAKCWKNITKVPSKIPR